MKQQKKGKSRNRRPAAAERSGKQIRIPRVADLLSEEKKEQAAGREPETTLRLPDALPEDYAPTAPEGLTDAEAAARAAAGQANTAPRDTGKSVWQILAGNLFTFFNFLNLGLGAALILAGAPLKQMLFLGVVVSNTVIATVQELRAKKTLQQLRLMNESPVRVLRGGTEREIPQAECVRGDLIRLRAGDQIPADAILREGDCAAGEALLTGEQDAVVKKPGDWLYSGSFLSAGSCTAQLALVGEDSYIRRLNRAAKKISTPHSALMEDLQRLIRWVSAALFPIGILLFCKQFFLQKLPIGEAVPKTVAAVLGMIPEGLMLLTSVALAVGVVKLGRRRTIVQELYGIETLARVDTLCLDKTGTLTTGRMAVTEMIPVDADEASLRREMARFLGVWDSGGSTLDALGRAVTPVREEPAAVLPFSSAIKKSAASFADGKTLILGAPTFVLGKDLRADIAAQTADRAGRGLRVLTLAEADGAITQSADGEKTLPPVTRVLGLVCISDELRAEAPACLGYFREQGVTLKIISGDDPRTVSALAEQAGIGEGAKAVDVSLLSAEELEEAAETCSVFGRVTPERKQLLVKAMQKRGHSVAMTGDGVNDIPAMKTADCSIAMAAGADAARHAAQLVLLDSDFTALPDVVAEGRRVINNISRSASLFLVKTICSFVLGLLMIFLPAAYPFEPIQLTLISTLTIGAPSFVLTLEPNRERIRGNFLRNVLMRAMPGGIAVAACAAVAAMLHWAWPVEVCQTLATLAAGAAGLAMLLVTCIPLNRLRIAVIAAMAGAFTGAVLLFGKFFSLVPLEKPQLLALGGMIVGGLAIVTAVKLLLARLEARRNA